MIFQDVVFSLSCASLHAIRPKIVAEVKDSGAPHVLKLWQRRKTQERHMS